jgi:sulfane dehydrogenase subunit SoxC
MSRAVDEFGSVQPTRAALMASRGANYRYHYNAIQSWNVTPAGEIGNVYV